MFRFRTIEGNWIGVILDEPNGNHNGTVQKKGCRGMGN